MLVLSTSLLVSLISFFLFKKAAGTMSLYKPNIVSVTFYLWLIGMTYTGLTLAMLGVKNYAHSWASDQSLIYAYWSVSYVLIAMPLGMVCYQKFLFGNKIKEKINQFYLSRLRPQQTYWDSAQVIFWGTLTMVAAISTLYSYYVVPQAPFVALISGESLFEVAQLRNVAKFEFPGNIYVKNLFTVKLTPIISYVAYGYYRLYKRKPYKIWFIVTIILSVLALTFTGEKAPIVIYVVTLILIRGIFNKGFSKQLLIFSFTTSIGLVAILYLMLDSNIGLTLYGGPISRMIMVPSAGLRLSFDVFPEMHGFLNGASLPGWMVNVFGMENERSARIVMETFNPSGVEEGTAGVINSLYVAEAWANFGLFGLIISPFFVGFVVQFIHNFLSSQAKTPIYVGLMGFFFFELPILGGFVDFVWNVGWIFILVIVFAGIESRQVLKGAIEQNKNNENEKQ